MANAKMRRNEANSADPKHRQDELQGVCGGDKAPSTRPSPPVWGEGDELSLSAGFGERPLAFPFPPLPGGEPHTAGGM